MSNENSIPVVYRGVTLSEWALSIIVAIWLVYGLVVVLASIAISWVMIVVGLAYTSVAALMFALTVIIMRGRRKAYQGHSVENALLTKSGRAYQTRIRIMLIVVAILAIADFQLLLYLQSRLSHS